MSDCRGNPVVSVVVPVYNGAAYLRESLDSILAQSYPCMEIILMDDASTDETPAIAASYGSRIHYHRQEQNLGQFANVNAGISRALGDFISVYHADDVYHPEIVARSTEFLLQHPAAGAVFCLDTFIDAEGRDYGRLELVPEVRNRSLLEFPTVLNALLSHKNKFLVCPGAMVRASAYREVGLYRPDFGIAADLDMWVRIAKQFPIGIIEEYLLRYRHFHGNSSQIYGHLRTEQERFFQVMDETLADGAVAELATPEALQDYAAHRAEDHLMTAINHYIRNQRSDARALLRMISAPVILRSSRVQRFRLTILLLGLRALCSLPHIPAVASIFYRRWHVRRPKPA